MSLWIFADQIPSTALHPLAHSPTHSSTLAAQELVFKLLEFVVCTLNFTPVPELEGLGACIASRTLQGDSLPLRTLIKLVNFDPRYARAF